MISKTLIFVFALVLGTVAAQNDRQRKLAARRRLKGAKSNKGEGSYTYGGGVISIIGGTYEGSYTYTKSGKSTKGDDRLLKGGKSGKGTKGGKSSKGCC